MNGQDHLDSNHSFSQLVRLCGRLAIAAVMVWAIAVPCFAQTVVGTITQTGMVPAHVAVYEAGNRVFVADNNTENVYTYDGTTLAELNSVHVGVTRIMVVDESHAKLYVGETTDYRIAVIDATTGSLIRFLARNYELAAWSDFEIIRHDAGLGTIYACSSGDPILRGILTKIDVATDSETTLLNSCGPLAVNTVTHEVFATDLNPGISQLAIINPVTSATTIIPGLGFNMIDVNPQENKVYFMTGMGVGVPFTIFNRNTNTTSLIYPGNDSTVFLYNPVTNRMYTDSEVNGIATIIDGTSDAFFNLPLPQATDALGVRTSTDHLYFASPQSILVVDDATQMVEVIPVNNPTPSSNVYQDLAINQTTGRVYVINDGSAMNSVTVVQDTPTLTRPPVYVGGAADIFVLDPATNTVVGVLLSSGSNHGLAVRPGGGRVYQPTEFFSALLHIYAGIGQSAQIATINNTGGDNAVFAAVNPDGSRVYVTNGASANVGVISTADNSLLTTVSVGSTPWGIALTPDGTTAYIANKGDNSVSVIATASNSVSMTIPVGSSPWGVAVNPSGTKVYVTNSGANTVSVIDTATNAVIATVPVGAVPHFIAVTPDGKSAYVGNHDGSTVSVIDAGTDTVVNTVTVETNPEGIAVLPDGRTVYVVNDNLSGPSSLSLISTSNFSVSTVALPTLSNGSVPIAIADRTSRLAGRVIDRGSPVSGALLRALQGGVEIGRATTNAAGDYSIFNLEAGTYDVEFSAPGYTTQTEFSKVVGVGRTQLVSFAVQGPGNPVPIVTSLSPSTLPAGSAAFTLSVNGSNFISSSVVRWNGSDRTTTFVSATQLQAAIPASDIATGGTAQITVFNPSPGGGESKDLSFSIAVPVVGLSPASLSFSSQLVGTTSAAQTVTLSNTGTAPLSITSISISSDFGQTNNCGASIAASAQCTFSVTFVPTAAGSISGTLTITDNASGSPQTVSLSGTGTAPLVSLSAPALSFGNQLTGTTSAAQMETVTNTGTGKLTISTVTIGGTNASDFAKSADTCAGATITPNGYCWVRVTFTPSATGSRSASLNFTDNASGSPQVVGLSGTGTAPSVSLSATSVSFGNQTVWTASAASAVTVTNTGTASLTFTSIAVTGDFAITGGGTLCSTNVPVAAGGNCVINVMFLPTATGNRSGSLTLADNTSGSPQTISLSGTGTVPLVITASSASMTYGGTPPTITPSYSGFVNGDTSASLTTQPICSTTSTSHSPAGSYLSSCSGAVDPNYSFTYVAGNVTVGKASLTITASNASKTYGAANPGFTYTMTGFVNGDTQASATTGAPSLSTTATAASPVGPYPITAAAGTLAATNYSFAFVNGTLTVNRATPVITWATPAAITYGTALSATQLDASSTVTGTFAYNPAAGTTPAAGTDTLSVTFTPSDTTDYTTATQTVSLTVSKATPTITWATPATITYGTKLSSTQLNATASVPGTFVYSPAAGSTPAAGTDTLSVTFTPTDTADYNTATASVTLAVADFTFTASSGSSTSATVTRGQAATYTLSVGGQGGMSGTVTFTCTGAPSEANCTVSPNPVTAGSSATNLTVTVTTTAATVSAPRFRPFPPAPPLSPGLRGLLMLSLVLAAMAWVIVRRKQLGVIRWQSTIVPLASGLLLILALAGCGGGGGGGGVTHDPGTPSGTYTLTVTGTAGSGSSALSHSVPLTLTVS